jgi:hypothetical protein
MRVRHIDINVPVVSLPPIGAVWLVTLQCQGSGGGPFAGGFLDGRTGDGSVGLAHTTDPPFTGTQWAAIGVATNTVVLACLGDKPGPHLSGELQEPRFLNGRTQDGSVGISRSTAPPFTGTKWQATQMTLPVHGDGVVTLRCLGGGGGPFDGGFLDGRTQDGSVGLAQTTQGFSGTNWMVHVVGELVSLQCLGETPGEFFEAFLDGRTGDGSVGMARRGTTGSASGTLWLLSNEGGITRLKNMGDIDGPRFLDGNAESGNASLTADLGTLTGARWSMIDAGQGVINLQVRNDPQRTAFLDGNTLNGHVGLAPSTAPPFTGTRWRKTSKRPLLFGLDHFKVENCRSKGDHNDSDWLTVTVTSGTTLFPGQVILLGDNLHAGDQVNGVYAGPFMIGDDELVTVNYYVVNLSHSDGDDQRRQAEQIALGIGSAVAAILSGAAAEAAFFSKGAQAAANGLASAIFGAVGGVLGGLAGILGFSPSDPNCNGEVLNRTIPFLPGGFDTRFPASIPGPAGGETSRSPSECGNDPHSTVVYGVRT